MNDNAQKAEEMFGEGFNCAQSVLACCGAERGMERGTAIRLGSGFGGGMGAMGDACGAVTGAYMVLGLAFARNDPKDGAAKQRVYALVREFARRFKERHGSVDCRDLIGCDISTPAGAQKAREMGVFKTLCPPLVRSAAEIVEDIIANPPGETK